MAGVLGAYLDFVETHEVVDGEGDELVKDGDRRLMDALPTSGSAVYDGGRGRGVEREGELKVGIAMAFISRFITNKLNRFLIYFLFCSHRF